MASEQNNVAVSVESPDPSRSPSANCIPTTGLQQNNMDTRIPAVENSLASLDQAIQDTAAGTAARGLKGRKNPGPTKNKKNAVKTSISTPASPHAPNVPSNLSHAQNSQEDDIIEVEWPLPKLDKNEYIIPLGVPTRVHSHYLAAMDKIKPELTRLFQETDPGEDTLDIVQRTFVELDSMIAHPDIVDPTAHEQDPHRGELIYTYGNSFKFALIVKTLEAIRDQNADRPIRAAVVARPGKVFNVLGRILDIKEFVYTTITNDETRTHIKGRSNKLRTDLVASDYIGEGLKPVDLIFVLDSSYDRCSAMSAALRGDKKTPVFYTWVFGSPEHVTGCMPDIDGDAERLRAFGAALVQTRVQLGQISKSDPKSQTTQSISERIAHWAVGGFESRLAFASIPTIKFIGLEIMYKPHEESNKRSRSEFEQTEPANTYSKRPRRTDGRSPSEDVPIDEANLQAEITALRQHIQALQGRVHSLDTQVAALQTDLNSTEQNLERVEAESRKHARTAHELMQYCDHFMTMSEQRRFLAAEVIRKNQAFEIVIEKKDEQIRRCADTIGDLQASNEKLKHQLKNGTGSLNNSRNGGSVNGTSISKADDGTSIHADPEDLIKKLATSQKKVENLERDRDFANQMYQNASSSALELVNDNATLQEEIKRLQTSAADVVARTDTDIDRAEIDSLRIAYDKIVAEKEDLVDQVRRSSSGRMNTRAQSSAPLGSRSPMRYTGGDGSPPSRSRASSRQPLSRTGSPTPRGGTRRGIPGRLQEP